MERSLGVPNAADPAVLDRFAADSRRSAADVNQVRSRLAGARISPRADRFGLVSDLIGQHDDAKRQVVDALDSVAEGFDHLDASAGQFAEAFRVASEVR
ncbi:hypothetical protein [Iamia sp.]|uniref:hypothetical protein n=1 Tax=Iamia sp. TaxID=2722710 RepID=UPI002BCBA86E|nr:hypothetical protein [Iamia sp.]HXH58605.1 hypothetical protein [Iamia sp.]